MTWDISHSESERLASAAEQASREGDLTRAEALYRESAVAEAAALAALSADKLRTRGITAISAVSLSYKGRDYQAGERLAHSLLADGNLPSFALNQLRELLAAMWAAADAEQSGIRFMSGDVLVSVKGGEVVHGGAPLDLILRKVDAVQAVLYRTVEMLLGKPLRKHGGPAAELQTMFRPWLFQAPAGSYQFAVRVQEPAQMELFSDEQRPRVEQVTRTFLEILQATSANPQVALPHVVKDEDYRRAFINLARNLAPTGKIFERLEVRDAASPAYPVATFLADSRQQLNDMMRTTKPAAEAEVLSTVTGILRAVHLDKDWLEVTVAADPQRHVRIDGAGDALDDVVGPMVNRLVNLTVVRRGAKHTFRDIELEE